MPLADMGWFPEAIEPAALRALRQLRAWSALDGFYLAGGTALALRQGHRMSLDLDFFSASGFAPNRMIERLRSMNRALTVLSQEFDTLHVDLDSAKVSFLAYNYPLLFPLSDFEGVDIADPRDIACMKINALAGRGVRRDLIDLYTIAQTHQLSELLELFDRKYEGIKFSRTLLLKSLTYFEDAEEDESPQLLVDQDWDEIKRFFETQVVAMLRTYR